ncbi:MAG: aminotransferase class IV, partial [Advenella sp.]
MWVVKDGTLLAPIKNHLILEGIRYGLLATLAERAGVPFEARNITRAEVFAADEILVTSATKEVLPVLELDGAPVGNGQPGPIYRKVRAEYDKEISRL